MTAMQKSSNGGGAPVAGCVACGGGDLRPHMRVGGDMGDQGLIPTTDRFGTALADLVVCPACGHMQLERFPSEEQLAEAYEEAESEDYVGEEAGQRATAAIALERIERYTRRGRLLDLGSWVGFLLAEARDRGWDPIGVEPSTFASRYAREQLGVEVVQADLFSAELPEHAFQAVVLGDVIEHLIEPDRALARIAELLAPGGVLYMALPDAGSRVARLMGPRWWSVIPTHVQYFTRDSMERLLRRSGWEPLWVGTAPKVFTVEYYLGRIGGYSRPVGDALQGAARRAGVAEKPWAPDFRDRMGVIARVRG
jgi:SAM-dependent methyltransferase